MEVQSNKTKKYSYLSASKFPVLKKPEMAGCENCICNRKRGSIFCTSCKKTFVGRIAERCQMHPEVAYLMDARYCAFCGAAAKDLQMGDPM
ncbi:hypothetical protein AWZ03_009472 [Drosophila navojoa]|uniref:Uncharacterized protein n=1 Tax=Drosophila navojoa TaxID=7232 RepID=A0A484B5F9_DRONA|nr:uncharacterized protein CG13380-like [Drosophila navojoa]TDG44097.1 hypothetical protein AWZ03_009472 [Drosophila navojoa]